VGWVLGLGAPLLMAVVWGTVMSPKAPRPAIDPARFAVEVVIFGAAATGLAVSGHRSAALLLGAAAAVHLALTFPLRQRTSTSVQP
jgi:hypothetical protein